MRAAAGISVLLLATIIAYVGSQGTVEARGRTPVECGDTLDIPGGRYVLTHDLQCSDYSGIMIAADDVRLDLSGFTIALVKTQSTPSSYAISVGYAAGGTCVPTSGVRISGGAVNGFSGGIGLCLASDARISQMVFADNSGTDGRAISLWQSDATTISDVSITRSQLCGVCLFYSSGNRLKRVAVQDVSGAYPHFYGLLLWDSDGNHIENGTVRNSGTGIQLRNSSGNRIEQNRVSGNSYYNVSLTGDSDQNVVLRNQVDQGGDGIYVGCCDVVPHFGPQRTIGADNNVVRGNAVSGNSRFGVAEVVGNIGSMFRNNTSSGNGVADSWPPAPLSELRSRSLEHRWAQERYRACAEAWWRGIDTEARAYQWLDPVPELVQETEELQQYVADNCSGVGAALAGVPGAAQAWCDDVSRVLGSLSKLFWPPFIQYAAVELQGFVAKANC